MKLIIDINLRNNMKLEEAYNFDMLVKWTRKVKALG